MDHKPYIHRDQEITLKDVILAVQGLITETFRSFKWIVFFAILGVLYHLYDHYSTPTTYTAQCTFMINEKDQNIGLTSLLGEFGIGGQSEFQLEKIAELARTRAMTQTVMFTPMAEEQGQSKLMANHFIDVLKNSGDWVKDPWFGEENALTNFQFTHDSVSAFNRLENKALLRIHKALTDRLVTTVDDVTGILKFEFTAQDETLTFETIQRLFEALSAYYTEKSVEKQQATFNALAIKCDSLKSELQSKEYQLADFKDSYRDQWLNVERTPEDRLYREIKMLSIMYGEALKNKEVAAFSLANVKPFIQAIDRPIYPLKKNQSVWWIKLIIGGFVGGVVGVVFVICRKIYREAMSE